MCLSQNDGPRESDEMSLNEKIFVGAVETISNNVFRDKNDEIDESAYMDDDPEDYTDFKT